MEKQRDRQEVPQRPVLRVKPCGYQPSKAELEADVSIPDATPEQLARAVMQTVTVREDR